MQLLVKVWSWTLIHSWKQERSHLKCAKPQVIKKSRLADYDSGSGVLQCLRFSLNWSMKIAMSAWSISNLTMDSRSESERRACSEDGSQERASGLSLPNAERCVVIFVWWIEILQRVGVAGWLSACIDLYSRVKALPTYQCYRNSVTYHECTINNDNPHDVKCERIIQT